MADIQSATAEIRRGKRIDRKKIEETTGQKYNGLPITMGGHKKLTTCLSYNTWKQLRANASL